MRDNKFLYSPRRMVRWAALATLGAGLSLSAAWAIPGTVAIAETALASGSVETAPHIPAPVIPGLSLPIAHDTATAIVILGYGLRPDGTMRTELLERLRAGYLVAVLSPAAPVIVTGGNPQGVSEARAMADRLIALGIAPERIHLESEARSTLENAALSAHLMTELGCRDALLISSTDHLPRATSAFVAVGIDVTGTYSPEQAAPLTLPFGPVS